MSSCRATNANRRLEVDYLLSDPQRPVALTVVDRQGREIECDDVVIALAWRLSRGRRRPRTIVGALRVLLDVAVSRRRSHEDAERAAHNLAQAEEHDAGTWVDEPVPYEVVDAPAQTLPTSFTTTRSQSFCRADANRSSWIEQTSCGFVRFRPRSRQHSCGTQAQP